MADNRIFIQGRSGKQYEYWIYRLGTDLKAVPGNYIFAKEVQSLKWFPIYIGETGDLSKRFDNHHKMPCALRNGATHIHVHQSSEDEEQRKTEETDLIAKWNPPCND